MGGVKGDHFGNVHTCMYMFVCMHIFQQVVVHKREMGRRVLGSITCAVYIVHVCVLYVYKRGPGEGSIQVCQALFPLPPPI